MKKLLKLASASGLMCLLFAIPAVAQITSALNFETTFSFYVGNAKLPAGSYKVTASSYDPSILQIENRAGTHSALIEFVQSQADATHKTTAVSFKRYGTTDFLTSIWIQGQQFGMQIEPTKAEQKLAAGGAPQAHDVAAKGQ
jgi:hypothetical protein